MTSGTPISSAPRALRETASAAVAIAVSIAVVAIVASTARSALLFRDGDSLVTWLVVRSLEAGQPQDWAMSSVLFVPETALVVALSVLGLGAGGTLAVAAVVTLVALYGAFRYAAGVAGVDRTPIAAGLLAFTAFAAVAATEASAARDSLELASLTLTTTYYSATVIAVVLTAGLLRRMLRPGASGRALSIVLAAVAAASTLTNPLFAVWALVPWTAVLGVVALVARGARAWRPLLPLAIGTAIGLVARAPLAPFIEKSGLTYIAPWRWRESLDRYVGLGVERWQSPWGPLAVLGVAALLVWCVVATVLLARRRNLAAAAVAAFGWAAPLLVTVGAVAIGTDAPRYLQPLVFAPMLGLAVIPAVLPARDPARRPATAWREASIAGAVAASVALIVTALVGVPRIATAVNAPDPGLACVVRWVDASERIGGGQFWTVRLPKAHVDDPRSLVQVDHRLDGYSWLVDRDDFRAGEVSFLVMDDRSPTFDLPGGQTLGDADMVDCGRYTIADFGERTLPIGPPRS